jgi:hypothetical protein
MAKGRMLWKSVSESDSLAALKDSDSQLLLLLLTPWWDDHGKMIGDEDWIKGNIVRKLKQFSLKAISRCLKNISDHVDVAWWTDKTTGNKYLYWRNFDKHEPISEAKKTKDSLPSPNNSPEIPKVPQEKFGEDHSQEEGKGKEEVEEEEEGKEKKEESPPTFSPLSEKEKEFFAVYEKHLGMVPAILVPELRIAANVYPLDWVQDAFITMSEANIDKPCWRYVNSILERWGVEGRKVAGSKKKQNAEDPAEFQRRYGHIAEGKKAGGKRC